MNVTFLDCEFTTLTQDARLISLALYHSRDSYFYAEMNDVDYETLSPWLKENVVKHLLFKEENTKIESDKNRVKLKGSPSDVRTKLADWIAQHEDMEIWADVLAYDWVLFCELFGGAECIPKNICYIPFDLATLFRIRAQNPDTDRFQFVSDLLTDNERVFRHHALSDALVGKLCYDRLMNK